MGKEIERKYLIDHAKWEQVDKPAGKQLRQGYILKDPAKTIRIRLSGNQAWLTIKGISLGPSRLEYEYEIPVAEGAELLNTFSDSELQKTRYEIHSGGKLWEVDVFSGDNQGLIVAEIELSSEDEVFELPEWVTEEVTNEKKYYNSNLTRHPFKNWL